MRRNRTLKQSIREAKTLLTHLRDCQLRYERLVATHVHFGYIGGDISNAIHELQQGIRYNERLAKEEEETQ